MEKKPFTETQARVAAAYFAGAFTPGPQWKGNVPELRDRIQVELSAELIDYIARTKRFYPSGLTKKIQETVDMGIRYGETTGPDGQNDYIIRQAIKKAGYDWPLPLDTIRFAITADGEVLAANERKVFEIYHREKGFSAVGDLSHETLERLQAAAKREPASFSPENVVGHDFIESAARSASKIEEIVENGPQRRGKQRE